MRGDFAKGREAGEEVAGTFGSRATSGGGFGTDFECAGGLQVARTLNAGAQGRQDYETETLIAHSLRADGHDASEDGTGRGTPLVFSPQSAGDCRGLDLRNTAQLQRKQIEGVLQHGVRRITPTEAERLQGFPDGYTKIPIFPKGKPIQPFRFAKDGPRYKAIGNSMAIPVMRWIGERIQAVDGEICG